MLQWSEILFRIFYHFLITLKPVYCKNVYIHRFIQISKDFVFYLANWRWKLIIYFVRSQDWFYVNDERTCARFTNRWLLKCLCFENIFPKISAMSIICDIIDTFYENMNSSEQGNKEPSCRQTKENEIFWKCFITNRLETYRPSLKGMPVLRTCAKRLAEVQNTQKWFCG